MKFGGVETWLDLTCVVTHLIITSGVLWAFQHADPQNTSLKAFFQKWEVEVQRGSYGVTYGTGGALRTY